MSDHGSRARYKRGCRCELCVEANQLYYARYRENNHERIRKHNEQWKARNPEQDKRYYEENKDHINARNKEYAEIHKEQEQKHSAKYYQMHAEEIKIRSRAWETSNPERRRLLSRKSANTRRARKLDQFVEDIDPQVVFERDEGICGICDTAVIGRFHVDHIIPLSKGGLHAYNNVQTAHPTCNERKGSKLQEEICQIR